MIVEWFELLGFALWHKSQESSSILLVAWNQGSDKLYRKKDAFFFMGFGWVFLVFLEFVFFFFMGLVVLLFEVRVASA